MFDVKTAAAALGVALLLAGCGQKGPLYLPDQGGEVVTRPGGQATGGPTPSPSSESAAPQPSTQTPADTTAKPDKKENGSAPR